MGLLDKLTGRDKLLAEIQDLRRELMRAKRRSPETSGLRSIAGLQEMILQLNERGEVEYVNSAFARMAGVEKADLVGKRLGDIDNFPWGAGLLTSLIEEAQSSGYAELDKSYFDQTHERDTHLKVKVTISANKPQVLIEDVTKWKEQEELFQRFVSKDVLAKIRETGKDFFKGERQGMTILFADLRGFTTMSEKLDPEAVRMALNDYCSAMMKIVDAYEGCLDKMIGDELMVLFGAPLPYSDHARRAILAALEMQQRQRELVAQWEKEGRTIQGLGIGINSGETVVGPVGSAKRISYTAIGHHVNLGRRVCDAASSGQILISSHTHAMISPDDNVRQRVEFHSIGQIKVKGITEPVEVFSVKAE